MFGNTCKDSIGYWLLRSKRKDLQVSDCSNLVKGELEKKAVWTGHVKYGLRGLL